MRDPFYDGVFTDANRTNEASGRSWHIPEDKEPGIGLGGMILAILGFGVVAVSYLGGML